MSELTQALIDMAIAIITACVPVITAFVVAWLKAKFDEAMSKKTEKERDAFEWAIRTAVLAAEQAGVSGQIENKKTYAIEAAKKLLGKTGFNIDIAKVEAAIEAAVWAELNIGDPTKDEAARNRAEFYRDNKQT